MVNPTSGGLSPELAKLILSMHFTEDEKQCYLALSEKAQNNHLTDDERSELDEFLAAETFLIVMKSKARKSLKVGAPAA